MKEIRRKSIWMIAWMAAVTVAGFSRTACPKAQTREIDRLLTAWHRAAEVADADVYFGTLATQAVFMGTDGTERWDKSSFQEWSKPYFQRTSAWVFRARERHIYLSADGRTAWFDELLDSASFWLCRGSGVLEKISGKWRIQQYVLSLTIPNDSISEIKPTIRKYLPSSIEMSDDTKKEEEKVQ